MKKIYNQLWEKNYPKVFNEELNHDSQIKNADDNRRGLTLLFRPSENILKNINAFLSEALTIEPAQYFYPLSDIHLTILSIISCEPNLKIDDLKSEAYKELLKEVLNDFKSFKLNFEGITMSSDSIMIQGFGAGEALNKLRNQLRVAFCKNNLYQTINKRYVLRTAHLTAIRFQQPLSNPQRFAEFLEKERSRQFGSTEVREVELVFNDWYQRKGNTSVLERFSLTNF